MSAGGGGEQPISSAALIIQFFEQLSQIIIAQEKILHTRSAKQINIFAKKKNTAFFSPKQSSNQQF